GSGADGHRLAGPSGFRRHRQGLPQSFWRSDRQWPGRDEGPALSYRPSWLLRLSRHHRRHWGAGTGTGGDWPDGGSGRGPAGSPASLRRVDAGSACGTLVGDKAELPAERPCSESGSHVREGERGRGLGPPHRQAQVSGFRRQGETTANASRLGHSDKKMKIVIAEKGTANAVQLLRDEGGWTVVTHDQLANGLASALPDADALIVRSAVNVNAQVLRGASKLRVIGRAGVGVDNIDLEAATKRGVSAR